VAEPEPGQERFRYNWRSLTHENKRGESVRRRRFWTGCDD
jgi:hypothetical protein